ncbi:AbrB/MazE/SpoVT family DNA-binding domain-containing protein [uncultured Anaerotruncus sp.]|uniref:AbrB/MazE/SpoVT family DNA-binding domain-containing protein n=1 Tax=uncultured Anaerotruncus sp. TaxID=905011 RepID=UPI00280A799B|nr:AbrB/MazE/SpoVT family DNA-binding domain-containing protein [uncultured Anaerotruncus sp.]
MELAKITAKGQITIPIGIRRKLGVKEGDKILFIEENGKIYLSNASKIPLDALVKATFVEEAE